MEHQTTEKHQHVWGEPRHDPKPNAWSTEPPPLRLGGRWGQAGKSTSTESCFCGLPNCDGSGPPRTASAYPDPVF